MAQPARATQLLIAAWAVTVLCLGALAILLLLSEPPPPASTTGAGPLVALKLSTPFTSAPNRADTPEPADDPSPVLPLVAPAEPDALAAPDTPPLARIEPAGSAADLVALSVAGPYGPLPRIADDGRRPLDVFATGFSTTDDRPRIAIIVTGLGLSRDATEQALAKLPAAISFAFSPYGYDLAGWTARARALRHELLAMVPMEPLNYPNNDPGPHVLLRDADANANLDRLRYVLSRFQGYVGVVNTMGSRVTANVDAMRPVLEEIKQRGLMFVDSRATQYTVAAKSARELGVDWAVNNRFVDLSPSDADIRRSLSDIETTARTVGAAVGLARPLPVSIDAIADWAAGVEARGFALVPISAVANRQPLR